MRQRLITYLSTIMEKADIPTRTECIQKFHEGPRPFWKNEPVNKFILYFRSTSNLKIDTVESLIRYI